MPLGAIIARDSVMDWPSGSHASTFGGNPVSCRAALATLDLLERGYVANAAARGDQLHRGLIALCERHEILRHPRGLGLMRAVDVVDPETGQGDHDLREELIQAAFHAGLLMLGCGEFSLALPAALYLRRADRHRVADSRRGFGRIGGRKSRGVRPGVFWAGTPDAVLSQITQFAYIYNWLDIHLPGVLEAASSELTLGGFVRRFCLIRCPRGRFVRPRMDSEHLPQPMDHVVLSSQNGVPDSPAGVSFGQFATFGTLTHERGERNDRGPETGIALTRFLACAGRPPPKIETTAVAGHPAPLPQSYLTLAGTHSIFAASSTDGPALPIICSRCERTRMPSLMVTGGCGFIGSNFIRICSKPTRARISRQLRRLTYAGNLANLADLAGNPRYRFRQRRRHRSRCRAPGSQARRMRHHPFRGREPRRSRHSGLRPVRPHQRPGHASAARRRHGIRRSALSFKSPPTRCTAAWRRPGFFTEKRRWHRTAPTPPARRRPICWCGPTFTRSA